MLPALSTAMPQIELIAPARRTEWPVRASTRRIVWPVPM
jgi:hypothetical protein